MKIREVHEYDASPQDVFAMLSSEKFLRAKADEMGDTELQIIELGESGDRFRIVTKRVVPANIPGFAKKFLPAKNTIEETNDWGPADGDGARSGAWSVGAAGAPVSGKGTMRLEAAAGGARNVIEGEVRASVPRVGGKLADYVGGEAVKTMTKER